MALSDRRKARQDAESPEDREITAHLATAKRELDKAMAVCSRVCRSQDEGHKGMMGSARQNRAVINTVLTQLGQVGSLKSELLTDIDLMSDDAQIEMSRERSLKRRAEAQAKRRVHSVENAVQNVLSALSTNR